MVSSARQAIACLLLIFCSALYAHSQTGPGAKVPTGSISGKVTIKGKGAAGIVVGLRRVNSSSQQERRYKGVTDDQGNYRINNVLPGHYLVLPVAPVFIPEGRDISKTIFINKDETVENVDIALVRGGVITGRVTDSDGRPAVEETVSIEPVQESNRGYHMPMSGNTDDRGIYRIYGLEPGSYRVSVGSAGGFSRVGRMGRGLYKLTYHPSATDVSQATIIEVTEGSEATSVDIVVGRVPQQKFSARGRIVDGKTGKPIPNVHYGLQYFFSESSSGSTTTGVVSNSEGEFKFDNLSPGKFAVFVQPSPDQEWQADSVPFEVVDQDISGLLVKTSRGATVSGVVVLEGTDDKAVHANLKQVQLHAYVMEGNSSPSAHWSTIKPDGSFYIRALKSGTLNFSLSNHGHFQLVRVERDGILYPNGIPIKEAEQATGVRFVLNYGSGAIRGVVKVESGTLPENAVITVSLRKLGGDESLSPGSSAAPVDVRGQFFVEGLIPGTYEVNAVIYIREPQNAFRPVGGGTKQQVVVTDGATNVTLTVSLKQDRP